MKSDEDVPEDDGRGIQETLVYELSQNYGELGAGHQESLKHAYSDVISAFKNSDDYTLGKSDVAELEFKGKDKEAASVLNAMDELGAISSISAGTYLNGYMDSEHNWKHFPDYFWEILEDSMDEVVRLQENI